MALKSVSALALATAASACAQDTSYFITFGDSYSQTGFNIDLAKPSPSNPLGNPPLPGWTASGGLDWVGFMVSEYNASTVLSYNFASGGATIDPDLVAPFDPSVISFIDQVTTFSENLAEKPDYAPWTSENTIAGVWMGVNDVGNSWWLADAAQIYEQAIATYFEQLDILYEAGIRKFMLLTVPPTNRAPALAQAGEQLVSALSTFNGLLATGLEDFTAANEGVEAKIIDTHVPFNTALDNPEEYGAPDATCFDEDGTSCLWFNDYHPGVEIHDLVGAQVAQEWGAPFVCLDSVLCAEV